jgi:hypothetical protein
MLKRVRSVTKTFSHSIVLKDALKQQQSVFKISECKLQNDVPTRWNSTYEMVQLVSANHLPLLAALVGREKTLDDRIEDSDWDKMETLLAVLAPMYSVTVQLCKQGTPTLAEIYPLVHNLLKKMQRLSGLNDLGKSLAAIAVKQLTVIHCIYYSFICDVLDSMSLQERLQELPECVGAAYFLDPRFKGLVEYTDEEKVTVVLTFTANFYCLAKAQYDAEQTSTCSSACTASSSSLSSTSSSSSSSSSSSHTVEKTATTISHENKLHREQEALRDMYGRRKLQQQKHKDESKTEVQLYVEEDVADLFDNPFTWWGQRAAKYPVLSRLARKFLCISGTSVRSERLFSTAGNIVTHRRTLLKPETVDRLVFLHENKDAF